MYTVSRVAAVLAALAGAHTGVVFAVEIPRKTLEEAQVMERECLAQLSAPDGDVACEFPTVMADKDRKAIQKITEGEFEDARCMVRVALARTVINDALGIDKGRVSLPPQDVTCVLETTSGDLPVSFTFTPAFDFNGGQAVKASPGMGGVKGVNSWLAWPVVTYINNNKEIREVMLRVINAYVERQRGTSL